MRKYTTRTEAVQAEIIDPIEAGGAVEDAYAEYDIDAIEDQVLADHLSGYALKVSVEEFWKIVEDHAL